MPEQEPKNAFVREHTASKNLTIESFDETRDWGGYYILATGPNYDVKILWVEPGELLSLQSHGDRASPGHHEIWTPLTNARVIRGPTADALAILDRTPGGIVTIAGGVMHSLANPFTEDVYVYEVRVSSAAETPQQREDRIKRTYDKYERKGTPPYPEGLLHEIMERPFDPEVCEAPLHSL